MDTVDSGQPQSLLQVYKPLLIIVGVLLLSTYALAAHDGSMGFTDWHAAMQNFMAGFFVTFSTLKLLDVRGFANGYAKYDLFASRVHAYGFIYPFLELALGLLYMTRTELFTTNVATLLLMTFSGLGVVSKLRKKEKFQCACLGTMIKVPLTSITLVEDFGMALMALLMLSL